MATIADFLKSIGMAEYAAGLSESGIDVSALPGPHGARSRKTGRRARRSRQAVERDRGLSPRSQAGAPADKRPDRNVERRHLTILFCDLVGSTAISTRVDPEALDEIMGPYRKCCAEAIERAGGFVARYLGDGVLAYFGYPQASEDAAERAVNAGLALIEAVGQLRDDMGGPLQTRVGIASGLVLIGDLVAAGAPHDHDVVGETPNLAARLQVTRRAEHCHHQRRDAPARRRAFRVRAVDTQPLKGFAMPMESWRVVKPSRNRQPLSGRSARRTHRSSVENRRPISMVGGWESAKAGEGRVLLISGEPGIGKSRIVRRC